MDNEVDGSPAFRLDVSGGNRSVFDAPASVFMAPPRRVRHDLQPRSRTVFSCVLALLLILPGRLIHAQPDAKQRLFEKVFGSAVRLDEAMRNRVLESEPGVRHYIDTDGDGKPDEVWFIDTATRHPPEYRPLLVRAIDEDGDLQPGHEPDLDSDLYVADWRADGSVDAVLDYTDIDGDGDLDEMGIYFYGGNASYFEGDILRVWWSRDIGDDNLLWFDIAYTYDQALCQYRTHFGGDEEFVAFAITENGESWTPFFESPFLFYDHDGDGVTEEVLRVSGIGNYIESIRHSFDVDNDATPENPRRFDASITAWAPGVSWTEEGQREGRQRGVSGLRLPDRYTETTTIRGIPTQPFLRHDAAREYVRTITWERAMLTWDEDDRNIDGQRHADENERWEGVIAHGNDDFPQVGGPSAGPVNERYEIEMKPDGPIRLYYHFGDERIHLMGADKAWLEVDTDDDRRADLRHELLDTDGDGVIDRWRTDSDLDGEYEEERKLGSRWSETFGWSWPEINRIARSYPILEIGNSKTRDQNRSGVAVAEDWIPPNIGWESEKAAYRMYWGQFDFFGKKRDALIYPAIGDEDYHTETEWGIDALDVGETAGSGGLILYVDGEPYPVMNPSGEGKIKFTKRVIQSEGDRAAIEVLAQNVGPADNLFAIAIQCSIDAGARDTKVQVTIEGTGPDAKLELGVGFTRMKQEDVVFDPEAGAFGTWGLQTHEIGRIGMGVVFAPERFIRVDDIETEHRIVLSAERGRPLVHHIRGDWLRGRRFSCCPSAADWLDELRTLASELDLD